MARKPNKNYKSRVLRQLLIFGAVVAGIYLALIFLIMPLYTRHWQHIKVPDVTNLSFAAAEKVIRSIDLVPREGEVKYDNHSPGGFVTFQNPLAHSFVKKGRRVYLVISRGKQPVPVPNLVGVNLRDVRFVLLQGHLALGKINYEFDAYYPEGVITEQSVEPEMEISAGSAIDITVSLGPEPAAVFVPALVGKTLEEAELLIKKARLTKGRVKYIPKSDAVVSRVLSQSLEPGLRAAKGDTIDIAVSTLAQGQEDKLPW